MVMVLRRTRRIAAVTIGLTCARTSSLSLSLTRRQALAGVLTAGGSSRRAMATTAGGSPGTMGTATTMRGEGAYNYQE